LHPNLYHFRRPLTNAMIIGWMILKLQALQLLAQPKPRVFIYCLSITKGQI
jgi:hypothetical protein